MGVERTSGQMKKKTSIMSQAAWGHGKKMRYHQIVDRWHSVYFFSLSKIDLRAA